MAESGYGKRFTEAEDVKEFALMQKMEQNIAKFTGGKLNAYTDELRRSMYKNGKKLSFEEWSTKAKTVSRKHLVTWRKTEERTMAQAASSASHWSEIERRAYLYPNLKYVTAHDELVRDSHRLLDGAIYPVSDPFWNSHYPPNGWNCRCIVAQTDKGAKPGNGDIKISKGMNNNAGKTGLLVAEDHPYFNMNDLDKEKVYMQVEKLHFNITKKEAIAYFNLNNPLNYVMNDGQDLKIMFKSHLKHIVTNEHRNRPVRNNMINSLRELLPNARFITTAEDTILPSGKQKHPWVLIWRYYLIELNNESYYLNIFIHKHTFEWGIYDITDTLI